MIFTAKTIKELKRNLEGEITCYNYNDCTVIEFEDPDEAIGTMNAILTDMYNGPEKSMKVTIEMSKNRYAIIEEFPDEE